MKNIFLILITVVCISNNCNSQTGWYQQKSNFDNSLLSISFLNSNTGIVVGAFGKILITRDGGLNWDSSKISTNISFLSVCILDSNIVLVSGYDRKIYKTTNFGESWYRITSVNNGFDLNEIKFPDKSTGYIASSLGVILKSTNVGESWYTLQHPEPFAKNFYSLDFIDANTGYVVGHGGSSSRSPILKTTNGGVNWTRQESLTPSSLYSVKFINPDTGIICAGEIIRTTNGGNNWLRLNSLTNSVTKLAYVNNQIIYAVGGNGTIIKSSNGGVNWIQQVSNTTNHLSGVCFVDEFTGYAVGANGIILKTTTGGTVGINTINTTIPESFHLYQNYPNPFNPVTNLEIGISKLEFVSLKIYDMLGKEVTMLANAYMNPGTYKYEFDASGLTSGVYFYKLEAGDFIETKKMSLIK